MEAEPLVKRMRIWPDGVRTDSYFLQTLVSGPILSRSDERFADTETARSPINHQPNDFNLSSVDEKKVPFNREPAEQLLVASDRNKHPVLRPFP